MPKKVKLQLMERSEEITSLYKINNNSSSVAVKSHGFNAFLRLAWAIMYCYRSGKACHHIEAWVSWPRVKMHIRPYTFFHIQYNRLDSSYSEVVAINTVYIYSISEFNIVWHIQETSRLKNILYGYKKILSNIQSMTQILLARSLFSSISKNQLIILPST